MTPICHGSYDPHQVRARGCAFCEDLEQCQRITPPAKPEPAQDGRIARLMAENTHLDELAARLEAR